MNSFLNTHNGTSLTGIIDITAHSISLFQENGPPKKILDVLFPYGDIAIAELVDVQINGLGNIIQMYQFIGDIHDERVPGLESIINYINDNLFSKADPAVNEHYYNIIVKKQYIEETNNIYNADKSKFYNIKNNRYTDEHQ